MTLLGWKREDQARCEKLLRTRLAAFRRAVYEAQIQTAPRTPLPEPQELAPGIEWRGNHSWGSDICILNRTLADATTGMLFEACSNKPDEVVALLKNLDIATKKARAFLGIRQQQAKKIEAAQHEAERALHALLVAEELKDANK